MHVEQLELKQFRNIRHLRLDCPGELHLFVGPNAQGKTNILESLYVLAIGKSHRTYSHKEMIQWEESAAFLKAKVWRGETAGRLEIRLTPKGKKVIRNGVEQRRLSDYIGSLTAVLFAPEDLSIVKGSPQVRRRFLDMEIGQVSPAYLHSLSQYNKLIHQRNRLLKEWGKKRTADAVMLDVMNEQLIELSTYLWAKRFAFVELLSGRAKEIHDSITRERENLSLQYRPSIPIRAEMDKKELREVMEKELGRIREREVIRGNTLVGPHRDDLRLAADGTDLHTYGSQGQQRTAALSLKLAEIELIHQETGHYPILLLDDVLSELDDFRKTQLLEAIRGKVQTFVTTTGLEGIDRETLNRARIYRVRQGSISEQR
ncbi:DNA replication and repair protein RecF [Melghirimyces profundicolus]|uniref:DNA replication and repair protein RecF n=1 Tax=Melghirimyces profundicolus TaxID=1242148 RepID=A0A2T6BAG2_9BACL|nr:DNA replication/repair protein RecF [Melghirimyces profundicolus]PTX53070.1 DNA replication and repair protein RecF [Melghirimyces profundicolus]